MTGRRSHGRLSALNGVVHQGSSALNGVVHQGKRAQQLVDLLRASSLLALPDGLFWCSASHGGSLPLRAVWLLADHSRFGEEPPLLLHAKFNIGWGIAIMDAARAVGS